MSDSQAVRELRETWYEYHKAMPWIHGRPSPAVAAKIEAVIVELEAANRDVRLMKEQVKVSDTAFDFHLHRANDLMEKVNTIEAQLASVTKEKAELQEALKLAMYEALNVKCGS